MAVPATDGETPPGLGFPMAMGRFAMRHPRPVIAAFAVTMVLAGILSLRLREAEDLLDFIPAADPDVKAFREVGRTFGALRVALVGIEAPGDEDVFSAATLQRIAAATAAARGVRGVDSVDSLTTVEDVTAGEGGPDTRDLIDADRLPASEAERQAVRARVLSRENVVGSLVSADGRAALIVAYLADGASDRTVSRALRQAVAAAAGDLHVVYGGAPFAASAIYEETEADVRHLTPLALLVLLAVILIAFRDPLGVVLTIVTVAFAALVVMGAMALVHEPFTAASATLPVILFASGTSYAVHLLGRYYLLDLPAGHGDRRGADRARLLRALDIVGPPVAIASFTTAAGFLSMVTMDIRPMRAFGIECAAGVLVAMVAAFLLVPAVLSLLPRGRHEPPATGSVGEWLARLARFASAHRSEVLGAAAVAGLAGALSLGRLQVRMEPRQFFRPGSQPWLAERFLADRFGGSQILQVCIKGDVIAPAALHEIKRLEQYARSLPDVTQVTSVVEPLMQLNDLMGGGRRLPETREQVPQLLFFIEGRAFLKRLLTPERDQALVLVRTRGDTRTLLYNIEGYLRERFQPLPAGPDRAQVAERLRFITRAAGEPIGQDVLERVLDGARPLDAHDTRLVDARRAIASALLTGQDEMMPRRKPGGVVRVPGQPPRAVEEWVGELASNVAPLDTQSPLRAAVIALAASPEEGALAFAAYRDRVAERTREITVEEVLRPAGPLPAAALPAIRDALGDLFPEHPIVRLARPLSVLVGGEPVLDRGMSRSVRANHGRAMVVAWLAVALLIGLLFRSLRLALISIVPAALTLVVLFGALALAGRPIDLGTSLVTSIGTGAGSEFAMQTLWYLKRSTPADVVRFVGPIMVISTLLIAAGFAVLAFGNAQPMRLFGSLAALSMVGSAALTFVLLPALLRRSDTRPAFEEKTA